jgi:hypothetical protein
MHLAVARQVDTGIVAAVRSALRSKDLSSAKRLVQSFRGENGTTPEALEALSWVARALLTGHRVREASQCAREAHRLAVRYLKRASLDSEPHLAAALGASIEVLAQGMAKSRRRAEAVRFLKREIAKFCGTPIHTRIRKTSTSWLWRASRHPNSNLANGSAPSRNHYHRCVAVPWFFSSGPIIAAIPVRRLESWRGLGNSSAQ